jgi:hypothetical protein
MMKCIQHPRYRGKRKPRLLCEDCWRIYVRREAPADFKLPDGVIFAPAVLFESEVDKQVTDDQLVNLTRAVGENIGLCLLDQAREYRELKERQTHV